MSILCRPFKKVIVADTLAVYADAGYAMLKGGQPIIPHLHGLQCFVTHCNFITIFGLFRYGNWFGCMFGIRLPLNFYSPYKASSIIDFWRRWHITLSRFCAIICIFLLAAIDIVPFDIFKSCHCYAGGLWHGAN